MAFSRATVKYKPLRVGLLVREGNLDDLKRAAEINCLLWGGIYNPIIPVSTRDNKFAEQLLNLFSVDILYKVSTSSELDSFAGKYPFLRAPHDYSGELFQDDWHSKKKVVTILDSGNIIDLFWEKNFKDKPKEYKSNFLMASWESQDSFATVFTLQFGSYPTTPALKYDFKNNFIKGLRAKELHVGLNEAIAVLPRKNFTPIALTSAELKDYGGNRFNGNNGLYLGESNDFNDLVTFWNIRATGISLVYVAKDNLERSLPYGQAYLNLLNSLPDSHPNIRDPITIFYSKDDKALRETLGSKLKSEKKPLGWYNVSPDSWNGLNILPSYHVFKWQNVSTHIEPAYNQYALNIRLPEKTFVPRDQETDIGNQKLSVIVNSYSDYGHPGHTLKLPFVRELNEFFSREIAVDPWILRVEEDGFSVIISIEDDSIDLYPLSKQKLIERLCKLVGLNAKVSQPGLIARKLIEKIGDLEDARVLKIKGVRKILQEGGPEHVITRGEATNTIHKNDFEKHKNLFIEPRESSDLKSDAVFDYLLKKEFFRAGLELICEQCKIKNWLTLKDIDDKWLCEYCGSQNLTSLHLRDRGDWRFRKSGLFSKDNHQEGAIPVLLTLLAIKRIADLSSFIYSTALELHGNGINCESDFFILNYKPNGKMEIAIGECKSEGGEITKDDCDKLKIVCKKLSAIAGGTKAYIIFSKTSNTFSTNEIKLFKELAKDINLILLTNRELEPYHIYWLNGGGIEENIPEKYAHSFRDLSANSYARYLKEEPRTANL